MKVMKAHETVRQLSCEFLTTKYAKDASLEEQSWVFLRVLLQLFRGLPPRPLMTAWDNVEL